MPDFLEEFASSVGEKKETMKERILRGKPNPLEEKFRKHFEPMWVPLKNIDEFSSNLGELSVTAIDSSVYVNPLQTGGIFYVIRSLAVCKDKEQKRLETNVFFTKSGLLEAHYYVGTKMEMLEFRAAIDALNNGFECSVLLIDGSLYGRAMHVPVETKVEEDRTAVLEYFKTYGELLDLCRERGIIIAGVSKESRATFYRDYLLRLIFDKELEKVDLEAEDKQKLKDIFPEILEKKETGFSKLKRLKMKLGSKLEPFELIFAELESSRPDYQVVMNFAREKGYTYPLLQGPSANAASKINSIVWDPKKFVTRNFPIATREKGKQFIDWASKVVSGIPDFPSFVSFYLRLDTRDSPMRIDLPCWEQPLSKTGWPKQINIDLHALLKIMINGYCGLDAYNLWLRNVDQKVKLKRSVVDELYFPYMEKLFGSKIIRGRSYRRVKFP
ncbi:MAG TPA: DNA double-strand break repair nuclease NurA [Candidatus Acidoferrum sp.]|nr:DNA double-strand break repair nuclease NurA [Candidatus Acidoferrum sp.]